MATRLSSRVLALLGPTNTGKTHRAIERMLAWPSGIIGLPLRLLAREVYERVVERRGPGSVALVTGEEKRIPDKPQYWVCTVEAMPTDLRTAFVAVDEVQLAGDRNRGHTFTDRLMHFRGTAETLFLGALTIAPLLQRLIPEVEIETLPRLSKLTWGGTRKLASVPPRSAVVAFSADKVYECAERLRTVHGGAAVVLGALSPRTRNAQVAMYQAGEVKHLVATDAIGMGLNMDVLHVAFTDVRKFDGRGFRELSASEVAQIAGRAGRHRQDGTFGTTKALGALPAPLVDAVEQHQFPPLQRLYWRNARLDFDSPEGLIASLNRPAPYRFLVPAFGEDDQRALEALLHRDVIRDRVLRRPQALRQLWEICRIPDYRKTRTGAHAELLARIGAHLLDDGELPDDFVGERIARLDKTDGDIETLMSRIAWIRTWTYVAWQRSWTASPEAWQQATRAVEDRLSDALHAQLTARFVDRRVSFVLQDRDVSGSITIDGSVVALGGIEVGRVSGWSFVPDSGGLPRVVERAVRQRVRTDVLQWVGALLEAPDEAITLDDEAGLVFEGSQLARLTSGPSVLEPKVAVRRTDLLEAEERERVRQRLIRWRDAWIEGLFAPIAGDEEDLTPPARGLLYALRAGLGTVDRAEVEDNLARLTKADRKALSRRDVRLGTRTVYVASLLRPAAQAGRAQLWSVHRGDRPLARPPADGRPTVPRQELGEGLAAALGFWVVGDLAVRADVLERVAAEGRQRARQRTPKALDEVMSWLGASREAALGVLRGLGFRVETPADGRVVVRGARRRTPRRHGGGGYRRGG